MQTPGHGVKNQFTSMEVSHRAWPSPALWQMVSLSEDEKTQLGVHRWLEMSQPASPVHVLLSSRKMVVPIEAITARLYRKQIPTCALSLQLLA